MWFWEYIVEVYNEETHEKEVVSGFLVADSTLASAGAALDAFYGDAVTNILTLKAIEEGGVFEFDLIEKEDDFYNFDFNITRKEK